MEAFDFAVKISVAASFTYKKPNQRKKSMHTKKLIVIVAL